VSAPSVAELASLLWTGVLAPLVTGGPMRPLRPLGPARAHAVARAGAMHQASDSGWVDIMRVRVARRLVRVDTLEPPDAAQWLLAAALNDLIQCTNPTLDGVLGRSSGKLLSSVEQLLRSIPPPSTLREALSRHATFARVLRVERPDTLVRWWSGSREFRGLQPPARLLWWKGLRRVSSEIAHVELASLALGTGVDEERYHAMLGQLVSLSPLTDLCTAGRPSPPFAWTAPALGLLASEPGRVMALRALRSEDPARAMVAVRMARAPAQGSWRDALESVAQELAAFSSVG
jgi:hypothetical protein